MRGKHIRSRRVRDQIHAVNLNKALALPIGTVLQRRLSGNLQIVIMSDGLLGIATEDTPGSRRCQKGGQDSDGEFHFCWQTMRWRQTAASTLSSLKSGRCVLFDSVRSVFGDGISLARLVAIKARDDGSGGLTGVGGT